MINYLIFYIITCHANCLLKKEWSVKKILEVNPNGRHLSYDGWMMLGIISLRDDNYYRS